MIYLLFLSCLIRTLPCFGGLDMTPVHWPDGQAPGPNNIHQEVEVFHYESLAGPKRYLNATLYEGSILDCLEEQFQVGKIGDNFLDLKQKRIDKLGRWFSELCSQKLNHLPCAIGVLGRIIENDIPLNLGGINPEPAIETLAFTGRAPQISYNTGLYDRYVARGEFTDSRAAVESTLEKAYRGQAWLQGKNRTTKKSEMQASAFFFRRNAALTAAHCVYYHDTYEYDAKGNVIQTKVAGWRPNIDFEVFPAYNNGQAPIKGYKPTQILIPREWINANALNADEPSKYYSDFAVLVFDENVADFTGSLGLTAFFDQSPDLLHVLNGQGAYVGGYPGTLGACNRDKKGLNANNYGEEIKKIKYYGTLHEIRKVIRDGKVLKHVMDTTPGQSGGPIMPHHDKFLRYTEEPYAMGITSNGTPGKETKKKSGKNFGVAITKEILQWALEVSNPYQLPGRSVYTLTFPEILNEAKQNLSFINAELGTGKPNPPLTQYKQRWGFVLPRLALKTSVLDQDRALSLHKYTSKHFLHNISGYYVALDAEKKMKLMKARGLYQRTYKNLMRGYGITEYKLGDGVKKLANSISWQNQDSIFRLGIYYLRGLGGAHNPKFAHWLFCLSKALNHPKGAQTFGTMNTICFSKNLSFGEALVGVGSMYANLATTLIRPQMMLNMFSSDDDRYLYFIWFLSAIPRCQELVDSEYPFLEHVRKFRNGFDQRCTTELINQLDQLTKIPLNDSTVNSIHTEQEGAFINVVVLTPAPGQ